MITVAVITDKYPLQESFIRSIKFADEIIVVVDSKSKPQKKENGITYLFRPMVGDFALQRNYALKAAGSDWILFVDDDEYVSRTLASEIKTKSEKTAKIGFYIPRLDVVYHQVLNSGETGKTKILRLAKRDSGKFTRPVHEKWSVSGPVGDLDSPLYHIKDHFISEFIARMQNYGQIDSLQLKKEGKYYSVTRLLLNPLGKFIRNYFLQLGLLDGNAGLFQAYLMSVQSLTIRVFQWEKRK